MYKLIDLIHLMVHSFAFNFIPGSEAWLKHEMVDWVPSDEMHRFKQCRFCGWRPEHVEKLLKSEEEL